MSYKSREKRNAYMRKRYHKKRLWAVQYLGGRCVCCGSIDNLEIDHINPDTKSFGLNNLWSVAWARYVGELDKCQLLCRSCHLEKSKGEGSLTKNRACGARLPHTKLTIANVKTIRQLLSEGNTQQVVADQFGVSRSTISHIANGRSWRHVPG